MRGIRDSESSGRVRWSEGIGWREVVEENLMRALKKKRVDKHQDWVVLQIRIGSKYYSKGLQGSAYRSSL